MERTILHCDCNGFYASVECALNPNLKMVPMAVGGSEDSRHGIILAKNELAKCRGVVTAETIWQARKKCPELVLVPPHHDMYRQYSRQVNEIYERYTDQVEPFGIDEAWLDVTGSLKLFGDGKHIADELRNVVKKETGLTISAGVSFNKIFAKLGSDYKKPDATTVITKETYKKILFPLPVREMLFVGRRAAAELNQMGIVTIGDLAGSDKHMLEKRFGKHGAMIFDYANGRDDSPVASVFSPRQTKSVGNGMTYRRDLKGHDDIKLAVIALSDSVAVRMRRCKVKCKTVQIMIKDPLFKTISRQKSTDRPTDLAKEIADTAMELIQASWDFGKPIRMLTITGINLTEQDEFEEQMSLFHADDGMIRKKQRRLESALDAIREKHGDSAVTIGRIIKNDLGIYEGTERIEHGPEET